VNKPLFTLDRAPTTNKTKRKFCPSLIQKPRKLIQVSYTNTGKGLLRGIWTSQRQLHHQKAH
jgi:hypothetical protein